MVAEACKAADVAGCTEVQCEVINLGIAVDSTTTPSIAKAVRSRIITTTTFRSAVDTVGEVEGIKGEVQGDRMELSIRDLAQVLCPVALAET